MENGKVVIKEGKLFLIALMRSWEDSVVSFPRNKNHI